MTVKYLVILYNGTWDGCAFLGAESWAVNVRKIGDPTISNLMKAIQRVLPQGRGTCEYDIIRLVRINDKWAREKITDDDDVCNLLLETDTPEVYVSETHKQDRPAVPQLGGIVGSSSSLGHPGKAHLQHALIDVVSPRENLDRRTDFPAASTDVVGDSTGKDTDQVMRTEEANDAGLSDDQCMDSSTDDELMDDPIVAPSVTRHQSTMNESHSSWTIPCMPTSFTAETKKFSIVDESTHDLAKDVTFMSKQDMKMTVAKHHLKNNVPFRVVRSDKSRWYLKCKSRKSCKFAFRAQGFDDMWRCTHYNQHTCPKDASNLGRHTISGKLLGTLYANRQTKKGTSMSASAIMQDLYTRYGISIEYDHAVTAKKWSTSIMYGGVEESFKMLPSYLSTLNRENPGSHVALRVTPGEHIFQNVFVALSASISGFKQFGRPVIVLDGAHLKGSYKGVAFVAVTQDVNQQIFPLAVGVGASENNDDWTWFLRQLREAFGYPSELLIVYDQHESICHAIKEVYPDVAHGVCCYHLRRKLNKYNKQAVGFFKRAAKTYSKLEYDSIMLNLSRRDNCDKLYKELMEIGPELWSRVHCPVRRYEFITNNAAETWNNCIGWARTLPVVYFLETVRQIIAGWFSSRRDAADADEGPLCRNVTNELTRVVEASCNLVVELLGAETYKVKCNTKSCVVDLGSRLCECGIFQAEMIPCVHAAAAIRFAKYDATFFVGECYRNDNVKGMWGGKVLSVPDPDEWSTPELSQPEICNPPPCPNQPGRPKLSGINSAAEKRYCRKTQRCSRCFSTGHNRSTCDSQYLIDVNSASRTSPTRDNIDLGSNDSG